jgi:hypothetical protein
MQSRDIKIEKEAVTAAPHKILSRELKSTAYLPQ